jgi:putative flippase GtrA
MIKRELATFLVVGLLTVAIDFLAYHGLINIGLNINISKCIAFIAGTIFAYIANRLWTFNHGPHKKGSLWRFILLYLLTLCANISVNAAVIELGDHSSLNIQISFLLATITSASLNFLGMKFFVFTKITNEVGA